MELLYSIMKMFYFKDKIDSLPENINTVLPPIHIRIKPTNRCNHNCRYCAYRSANLQLGKDMVKKDSIPLKKMTEIIDDIAEMGGKAVTFSGGGEPFCYPYLLDAVKKLSSTAVKFSALTNGALLGNELAEIFAYHGSWLRVSMDGWDDKSYSFYRKVPQGEFKKIMRNMENFKRLNGKCYLGVSLIIDRNNASHIYKAIQRLKNVGVDSIKVSPCIVSNNGLTNHRYHQKIFDRVKKQIRKAIKGLADDKFEIYDSYHELNEKFKKDYTWCPSLQILPIIGADLNIYSCQDKAYNVDKGLIGSIRKQSFKDFWFAGKDKFFRINPHLHCNHHCVANIKNKLILEFLNINKEHLFFV